MRTALSLLTVLLLLGAVAWWLRQPAAPEGEADTRPPVPVTSVAVETSEFRDEVSALGTLLAWESVAITASVSQIVTELSFDDGQQVTKGDVLALLKQEAEQATLRELRASLQEATRELRRLEGLARQKQVAQTELDKARTREEITRHRIEEAESRIADRTIVAPFSGVLGLRRVSAGALVTPGQQLTTLDDISRMRLEFTVPASRLGFLLIGQQVVARTPAYDRAFRGTISALDSRVDPVTRAITARAVLENPQQLLRPGLLMEVTIHGAARQALLIPEQSIQSRSSEQYVWKISGDQALRTAVQIGGRTPGWVEVVAGLREGDLVVRDGVGRLSGDSAAISRVEP